MNPRNLALFSLLLVLPTLVGADNHGAWWKAEETGCLVWNWAPGAEETVTWTGGCVSGKANGPGRLVWRYGDEDGAIVQAEYTGKMRDGKMNGEGTFRYADGNTYEGDWVDERAIHLAPVLSICSSEHFLEIARFRT